MAESAIFTPLFAPWAHRFRATLMAADAEGSARGITAQVLEREKPAHTAFVLCTPGKLLLGLGTRVGVDAFVGAGPAPLGLDGWRLDASAGLGAADPEVRVGMGPDNPDGVIRVPVLD